MLEMPHDSVDHWCLIKEIGMYLQVYRMAERSKNNETRRPTIRRYLSPFFSFSRW